MGDRQSSPGGEMSSLWPASYLFCRYLQWGQDLGISVFQQVLGQED